MTAMLNALWSTSQKPFHDETIYPVGEVSIGEAVVAISSAFEHIAQCYPDSLFYSLDDWHEHDGFVTASTPTTLEALKNQISTPESYISNVSDDYAVYRAVYPDTLDFILRFGVLESDVSDQAPADRQAHWSFTGYGHDIHELKKRWGRYGLASESSPKYFNSRYAG